MISFSSLSKRRGATLAGVFSLALSCVLLLCGAGSVPIENLLPQGAMQGDLNAGGHNLTNAATVSATNVVVSGSLTAPASFTLPFSELTSTPTTLSGYGITDAVPNARTVNGHALSGNVAVTPADLSLVIGTNVEAWNAHLDTLAASNPFTAGTNISFSGTWPAITINASGGGGGGGSITLGSNQSSLLTLTDGVLDFAAVPNGPSGLIQEGATITDSAGNTIVIGDETSNGSAVTIDSSESGDNALTLIGNVVANGFYNGTGGINYYDIHTLAALNFGYYGTTDNSTFQLLSRDDGTTALFEIGMPSQHNAIWINGIFLYTGPNTGTFTLSSGSATVSNSNVTANSVILCTIKTASGSAFIAPVIIPTAGTGFTVSGATTDHSTYNYIIIN